jgi:antirestriction protein ArdC
MLCSEFNIDSNIDNHASYLDSWLGILKQDKRAFFKASSLAMNAANFILQ